VNRRRFLQNAVTAAAFLSIPRWATQDYLGEMLRTKRREILFASYSPPTDGITDCSSLLNRAMRDAVAARVPLRLPAGTFRATSLDPPDGLYLVGAGKDATYLNGRITFGSNQRWAALKLGDQSASVRNKPGAHYTQFVNARLRGGGGSGGDSNTILLGNYANSVRDVTFKGCDIECTLGNYDNVRVTENSTDPGGAHVEDITFDGCHFGVHNGVRQGCPRMDFEAYCDTQTGGTTYYHGWERINFTGCTFEASDWYNVDLTSPEAFRTLSPDYHGGCDSRISGCTLKGGDGYTIVIESPKNVVIENNTIYRGGYTFKWGCGDMTTVDPATVVRNNTIDTVTDMGVSDSGNSVFYIRGGMNVITDNVITTPSGRNVFYVEQQGRGNVTSPNTINGVVQ